MVETYRGFDKAFKYLFDNATEVSATALYQSGTLIGSITVDGQIVNIYAPSGGGSTVTYSEGLQSGTLVGTLTIDGVSHNLYCTSVEANPQGQATGVLSTLGIGGTVYEIQGGGGSTAHHYSLSEQIVGTWIDGSTLYEKTYDLGTSGVTISSSSWTDTTIPKGDISKILNCIGIAPNGASKSLVATVNNSANNVISLQTTENGNKTVRYFTIQYTKT